MARWVGLTFALVVACASPGCVVNADVVEITLDGSGVSGREGKATCGPSANLTASADLTAGVGQVTITDADGETVFTRKLYEQDSYEGTVSGANGTWTMHVGRSQDSAGVVTARLVC